ncbi:MAG: tetratricopeptide repeat protein [Candidatus Eremiobacteraeota bacterium]|nr:tetratricopeptide repeat protein [Candidatus Eremiobacteraeota bacterium]MCW5867675.1 tetratricopeptide repeat protein [Candidatus Eremiobacteraeota bacterium]
MKNFLAVVWLASCAWATPADLERANELLSKGQPAEARTIAEQELAANPKSLPARLVIAKSALAQNDIQTAHGQAAELVKAAPESSDYNALFGLLLVLEDQAEAAIPYLEKSVDRGVAEKKDADQMASFSNTLVTGLHQAGQTPMALKRCLEFLKLYPSCGELYLSASRLYRERSDYQNALVMAQDGLRAAPAFSSLYASLALAEAGLGHKDLSEKAYQQLLAKNPELAKVVRRVLDGTRKDSAELQVEVK